MSRDFDSLKRKLLVSALLVIMLCSTFAMSRVGGGSSGYGKWGPRVDSLQLIIYGSDVAEVQALRAGEIDVMDWPLDYENYMDIKDDPAFVVEPLTMFDIYDIDINCYIWPTSDYRFRQAIAHLIDYEWFYTTILRAYAGELMDNIIWWESAWSDWYNSDAPKYWYNATLALEILEAAGYKNWDPSDDWLEWKAPNNTIYDLPNLDFYIRADDSLRLALGDMINAELNAVGIPTTPHHGDYDFCDLHVYSVPYDYNLYTAGMGPFRDVQFLYDYYHSQFATHNETGAWNNVFFMNDTYDGYVEALKFAPDEAAAQEACKEAQVIFMDQVPLIPVYHSAGSTVYRTKYGDYSGEEEYRDKPWNGFINSAVPTVNSGVSDWWSLLNAHPGDVERGGVLRFGMLSELTYVNPVTPYSVWDYILLAELYNSLIMRDPYNGDDIPWLAKDWTIETWDNGGTNATKLTYHLCANVKWSDGTPLNSSDVAFTMKYMYDASQSSYYSSVDSIDGIDTETPHIETPDATTVIIYFSVETVWALEMTGNVPIIPKHVWETIPPESVIDQGEFVYGANKGNLTCSGPYVIAGHEENQWWLLRANPYFFRHCLGDFDGDFDVDEDDLWHFCGAFIDYYKIPKLDSNCDFNSDGKIDEDDLWTFCAAFINYWKVH